MAHIVSSNSFMNQSSLIASKNDQTTHVAPLGSQKIRELTFRIINEQLQYRFNQKEQINIYVEQAQNHSVEWAQKVRLVTRKNQDRLFSSKFAHLMAGAHPHAGLEELKAISDWVTMLFLYDDKIEKDLSPEKEINKYKADLKEFNDRNLSVLKGAEVNEKDHALTQAIADLRSRFYELRKTFSNPDQTQAWFNRFIKDVSNHFDSLLWEASIRSAGKTPDLTTYIEKRQFTGAVYLMFDLIQIAEHTCIPNEILDELHQISLKGNNMICLSNDIISYHKEPEGVENIVNIFMKEHNSSFEEAVHQALRLHNEEFRELVKLIDEVPKKSNGYDLQVKKYIDGVIYWIESHISWAQYKTSRYK